MMMLVEKKEARVEFWRVRTVRVIGPFFFMLQKVLGFRTPERGSIATIDVLSQRCSR